MSARIVPIIFARFDSQRLPGKVLKPLLGGKSIVEELLQQLDLFTRQVPHLVAPIIATTSRPVDRPILQLASEMGVDVQAGHLLPLIRLQDIAARHPRAWLWRLNADSPLLLQLLLERAAEEISLIRDESMVITNLVERSFPYGISLEMFRADMIAGISADQATPEESEHLTPIVKRLSPGSVNGIVADDLGLSRFDASVRLTIDDLEDAEFFRSLWDDTEFQGLRPGSLERVEYAYRRRRMNET